MSFETEQATKTIHMETHDQIALDALERRRVALEEVYIYIYIYKSKQKVSLVLFL